MSFCCLAAKSVTRFLAAIALARCGRVEAVVVTDALCAVAYHITLSTHQPEADYARAFCKPILAEGTAGVELSLY